MILLYVKKKSIEKRGGGWSSEIKGIGIFINRETIYFY